MDRSSLLHAAAIAAFALAGCASRAQPPTLATVEPPAFGAALASIDVVNRTAHPLAIAYRAAAGPGREVVIGKVDPGARGRLAPVPAGEAIVLIAHAKGLGDYALAARAFTLGQEWEWEIPADATFRPPEGR